MTENRQARPAYPVEFRQQILELIATGRSAADFIARVWRLGAKHWRMGEERGQA